MNQTPNWLKFLERRMRWLAIPNIAILLVTLQALGFLMLMMDPTWLERLALFPQAVFAGEYWRLITFLALPLSLSPVWMIFILWFLYFIVNSIEQLWGAFQTTFYVLLSVFLTIGFSLVTGYPITSIADFESTLFLAAATLFPEFEIRLFFVLPVKMKWLGVLTLVFLVIRFIGATWLGKLYLLAIYFNYMLFFGPALLTRAKDFIRRERYKRKLRG
ncbi:MAG: hypothetical protein A3K03_08655 [Bdellovibrionales bacterium RIFOXYD1_FULL_44_7]|nr:MAG: hypothetical protein A3K03_08655 [Bdellovibrionales bacterium RIFOXYD1_FULL_44_7]